MELPVLKNLIDFVIAIKQDFYIDVSSNQTVFFVYFTGNSLFSI